MADWDSDEDEEYYYYEDGYFEARVESIVHVIDGYLWKIRMGYTIDETLEEVLENVKEATRWSSY